MTALRLVPPVHRATHRIGLSLAAVGGGRLTQGEAHILALLAETGPSTIASLHTGLGHRRSTLTSILDRLAARGLVTREVGRHDRRTFVVATTAKGRETARAVHAHLAALERRVATRVSKKELDGFLKVIAAIEEEAR